MNCLLIAATLCTALSDRPAMALTAAQTTALIADGITTRQFVAAGYHEANPVARVLIGRHPTWARMVPVGAAETLGALYLGQRMKHSNNRLLRKIWWLPQTVGISSHGFAAGYNIQLRR